MKAAREQFARFLADECGATAIEYGLIAGLVVLAIVSGVTSVGAATSNSFNAVADGFPEAS